MIETLGDELFELKRARLLALLARLSYERREVTLASGRKSDFYIDCKQTVLTAEGHYLVGTLFGRLLMIWQDTYIRAKGSDLLLEQLVTEQILEDPGIGPIARNVARLWYLGMWFQLPAEWRNVHGAWANDVTFVVSPQSYTEGLVWKAIHTHPPAAKQPGYGSWALPPVTAGDAP